MCIFLICLTDDIELAVKKFPAFPGTWFFFIMFMRVCHCAVNAKSVKFTVRNHTSFIKYVCWSSEEDQKKWRVVVGRVRKSTYNIFWDLNFCWLHWVFIWSRQLTIHWQMFSRLSVKFAGVQQLFHSMCTGYTSLKKVLLYVHGFVIWGTWNISQNWDFCCCINISIRIVGILCLLLLLQDQRSNERQYKFPAGICSALRNY